MGPRAAREKERHLSRAGEEKSRERSRGARRDREGVHSRQATCRSSARASARQSLTRRPLVRIARVYSVCLIYVRARACVSEYIVIYVCTECCGKEIGQTWVAERYTARPRAARECAPSFRCAVSVQIRRGF